MNSILNWVTHFIICPAYYLQSVVWAHTRNQLFSLRFTFTFLNIILKTHFLEFLIGLTKSSSVSSSSLSPSQLDLKMYSFITNDLFGNAQINHKLNLFLWLEADLVRLLVCFPPNSKSDGKKNVN